MAKKKKIKTKITKQDMHNIKMGHVRQDQKDAGFFDGRFRSRSEESNKKYTRKKKHKNKGYDQ